MSASILLYVGNKNLSSWSLRPYLALAHTGIPFEEVVIRLDRPDTREQILAVSPSGRVPALRDGAIHVWDSLAICEHLAERFPEAKLWPANLAATAASDSGAAIIARRSICPAPGSPATKTWRRAGASTPTSRAISR